MPKDLVLITGATGHLGFRTLVLLLQTKQYRARVAIRRPAQESKLLSTASIRPFENDVEFVVVPDITAADAYSEAVKGVKYVLHIASPTPIKPENQTGDWNQIYYEPAVNGTLSILRAAAKAPGIIRIVITATVGVLATPPGKKSAGPDDLAQLPDGYDSLPGEAHHSFTAYRASKMLSYKAASDFVNENKVDFELVRISPGYIQGPHELIESDGDFYTGSNEGVINAVVGNLAPYPKPTSQVYLDDVAEAHVLALDAAKAQDGDHLVVVGNGGKSVSWDHVGEVAAKLFPGAVEKGVLQPVKGQQYTDWTFDIESSERKLGIKFKGTEDMVRGLVKQYLVFHGHTELV